MTDNHPITPSIELVKQWSDHWHRADDNDFDHALFISIQAARWGADQELEACVEWLNRELGTGWGHGTSIRAARRPKPPSLKEQALETLRQMHIDPETGVSPTALDTIRRALEQLDD